MRFRDLAFLVSGAGAASLVYGFFVESGRLVLEKHTLPLPNWPERLRGFRIAVLTDLHLLGPWSLKLAKRAVALALEQEPDMVVIAGDFVESWHKDRSDLVREALEPLLLMDGNVVAVPGNHDYRGADAEKLRPILDSLNIRFLKNEVWNHQGIAWVGLDSILEGDAKPIETVLDVHEQPAIVVWHEPDMVGSLPEGIALQISGHSHGGQFRFFGFAPAHELLKKPSLGTRYSSGFYAESPTPIYVSRGVGVTGPPTRFHCPPEVSLLTLVPTGLEF